MRRATRSCRGSSIGESTGTLAADPPGRLTLRETVLVEGEAAQNVMRWEDYSQTAVDPSDDCII